MIAPDVNLLVHTVDDHSPFHTRAKAWLNEALSGEESMLLAWNVVLGFLRITTNSRALPNPLTIEQALDLVALWLAQPNVTIVEPGPRHFGLLRDLLIGVGTGANLTSDAHLAAIAIEQDAEVHSTDADFRRFRGLRWRNPLES
ncbi:MAG: type II toxin-antitoxin system VapC family toxin [Acidobacteriaceae bacterium]|nr:type II toxin-antitoxin system VapC family toxin [Acidobacteriaceae bacterium]MBV9765745.1 type II toxin-antitoxin system VapC family toxin [Acidobacteriaceae bacterium]